MNVSHPSPSFFNTHELDFEFKKSLADLNISKNFKDFANFFVDKTKSLQKELETFDKNLKKDIQSQSYYSKAKKLSCCERFARLAKIILKVFAGIFTLGLIAISPTFREGFAKDCRELRTGYKMRP